MKKTQEQDTVLQYVRDSLRLRGGYPVKEVTVEKMPPALHRKVRGKIAMQACFHNTLVCLKALKGEERDAARYVLGYWHIIIPIEHCFLKIGDTYYDPTGETYFADEADTRHFSAVELTYEEVQRIVEHYRKRHRIGRTYLIDLCDYYRYTKEVIEDEKH